MSNDIIKAHKFGGSMDLKVGLSDLLDKYTADTMVNVGGGYKVDPDTQLVMSRSGSFYELPDYINDGNYSELPSVIMALKEAAVSGFKQYSGWSVRSLLEDPYEDRCFKEHQTRVYGEFYKAREENCNA